MKLRYIPAVITLIAGTITSIISIIYQNNVIHSLILLLVVLIVFYIIGNIAKRIIAYAMMLPKIDKSSDEDEVIDESIESNTSINQSEITEEQ